MSNRLCLAPLVSAEARDILHTRGLLASWASMVGSPFHVILPAIAARNALEWQATVSARDIACDIRFALKSCKSNAVVKAFGLAETGADVSSVGEIRRAIEGYVPPSRISYTGPQKPDHDLMICLSTGIAVHIDTPSEADRLIALAARTKAAPRVMLRLKPDVASHSRFGMSAGTLRQCALALKAADVTIEGISFHLGGYSLEDRVKAAGECLAIASSLEEQGIGCRTIDIGGGFPMRYLEADEEDASLEALPRWGKASMRGDYPYHSSIRGPQAAAEILDGIMSQDRNRAIVKRLDMAVIMEPGRALLDQCGLSVFRVIGRKDTDGGMPQLVLDGMNFSLSETWFGADFLPTPYLVNRHGCFPCTGARFALAGRSCMESDFIRRTGVDFPVEPGAGDLIVFINTAGYQMDSNESRFHEHPLPRKIAAVQTRQGWQPIHDEIYSIEEFQNDHLTHQ
jgi:diaminopimelate decarboxylase